MSSDLKKSKTPKSRQIADQLCHEIAAGHLKPGEAIYSLRTLAARFAVSPSNINGAYKILEKRGVAICEQGRGTFVAQDALRHTGERPKPSADAGCDFVLLTSYKRENVADYFDAQTTVMAEEGSLCFTCPVILETGEHFSPAQLEQLKRLQPSTLLVDFDGARVSLAALEALRRDFPLVYFNRWLWSAPAAGPAVLNDFQDGCFQAGRFLESGGCDRLAVIGFADEWRDAHRRSADHAARGFGMRLDTAAVRLFSIESFANDDAAIQDFFSAAGKVGVFGLTDYVVAMFLDQYEERFGSLPELEVIGTQDAPWSKRPGKTFSSIRTDYAALWRCLIAQRRHSKDSRDVIWVKPELVQRKGPKAEAGTTPIHNPLQS